MCGLHQCVIMIMDRCRSVVRSPCFPVFLILFMQACTKIGLVKAMGILFADLSKSMEMTSADLGIALGLFYATGLLSSPIVATVMTRTSHPRFLLIIGAIVCSCPIIIASRATYSWHFFITFSISGIGYTIVRLTCLTLMDRLAGEHFNLLFSLSTCGMSAGIVIFPLLAEVLLTAYDWRGVILITGGLALHNIPCAMAARITPKDINPSNKEDSKKHNQEDGSFEADAATENVHGDTVTDTDLLLPPSADHKTSVDEDAHTCPNSKIPAKAYLGYLTIIPEKISSFFRSMGFYDDPFSLFIFASIAMHFFVYNGWHDFLIPQALQRGISEENTIMITFVAGVGNISIRLTVALLMYKCFEPVNIFLILTFINTISLTFDAFFPNYHVMLVTSFCSTACISGRTILKTVLIRNRFSSENLPMALGVNNVCESVTYFLGGYLSGLVADTFSSYDATILLLAAVDMLAFVFMLFPKIKKKPEVKSQ